MKTLIALTALALSLSACIVSPYGYDRGYGGGGYYGGGEYRGEHGWHHEDRD